MAAKRKTTLEDCKAALRTPRTRIVGAPPKPTKKTVSIYLLSWAVREIERLRDPDLNYHVDGPDTLAQLHALFGSKTNAVLLSRAKTALEAWRRDVAANPIDFEKEDPK